MNSLRSAGSWLAIYTMAIGACVTVAVAADSAPIRLTAEQLRAAGISIDPVTAIAHSPGAAPAAAGSGILLHGQVVVPNDSIEVVLANVAGQLESVAVNPGQPVRAGQVLGRVYSAELLTLQRDYLQARGQLELATARSSRDASLFKDGIVSAGRLQESQAAEVAAAASFEQARQMLRIAGMSSNAISRLTTAAAISPHLTLTARAAGVLLEQSAPVGQRLQGGDTVFRLAAGSRLNLELQVARADALRLRIGDLVSAAGCATSGHITSIGAQLSPVNQTVNVRAQFSDGNGCLRPNEYLQVTATPSSGAEGLLSVAAAAVTRVGAKDYVFVSGDGGFRPVAVTVVQQVGDRIWVRSELSAGQSVARSGVAALKGTWQGLGAAAQVTAE